MSYETIFPSLGDWEPTRDTLHAYIKAVGVVPRAHADFHPKWWHISLKVRPDGLQTETMAAPDGDTFHLRIDLRQHSVILVANRGIQVEWPMTVGLSATVFGNQILDAVADLGLTAEYAREKFEDDSPRVYNPGDAEKYFHALVNADRIFKAHRATLSGEVGPVQLWPHGFDLAFEWFGTRFAEYEKGGEITKYPAQLNLGFSPGESSHSKPYFYSNPWPFEADALLDAPLPRGARWFTNSWQGTILPYAELADEPDAEERLLTYARSVYEITSPTLLVD